MTPRPAQESVLDLAPLVALREIRHHGGSVLARVVATYLETTPETVEELRAALGREDRATAVRTAHNLKSSSAMVGGTGLAERFRLLESHLSEDGALEPRLWEAIAPHYRRVVEALEQVLREEEIGAPEGS